jgi:hypothetical protein
VASKEAEELALKIVRLILCDETAGLKSGQDEVACLIEEIQRERNGAMAALKTAVAQLNFANSRLAEIVAFASHSLPSGFPIPPTDSTKRIAAALRAALTPDNGITGIPYHSTLFGELRALAGRLERLDLT